MVDKFIEVTQATVVTGGIVGSGSKRLIGTDHIVLVLNGEHDTSVIWLSEDDKINVRESYAELKKLLGVGDA